MELRDSNSCQERVTCENSGANSAGADQGLVLSHTLFIQFLRRIHLRMITLIKRGGNILPRLPLNTLTKPWSSSQAGTHSCSIEATNVCTAPHHFLLRAIKTGLMTTFQGLDSFTPKNDATDQETTTKVTMMKK
jgi:hypothetical protein